jgi:phage tail sheath protein FI
MKENKPPEADLPERALPEQAPGTPETRDTPIVRPDPERNYINIRRYMTYLEHSLDAATQWVVFWPNGDALWDRVRTTVEDFLLNEWKSGALLGDKPEEAYFVHCDRTTMTQNDLDNGRLVCVVGVAPIKPAEFVIFRIGQWTADHTGGTQRPG